MEDLNQVDDSVNTEVTSDVDNIFESFLAEEPAEAKVEVPIPSAPKSKSNILKDKDTVVLYSNINLKGISKGYSEVDKELAKRLLKSKNVRIATEAEIKEHFNK